MPVAKPGKLVRLHLSEEDQFEGKALYEAIVNKCQELDVAGVTVLRSLEGFGESTEMHRPHMFEHDQPIVVTIVETADKVNQILPELEQMLGHGVIAVSDVEMIRIQNSETSL